MTINRFIAGLLLCGLILSAGCGKNRSGYDYKVAFDPAWYSVSLQGRESLLTAFSTELIEAIGKQEKLKIGVYQRSWTNLMLGLQENDYQAFFTPMPPYVFYEKLYNFSNVYLPTGPVIIVAKDSTWNSLEELGNQEVGILQGSSYALMLDKYPTILQRVYDSPQAALEDLAQGVIEAMLLDVLAAKAYTNDLYQAQLKISSLPLTLDGVRLVGLRGNSEQLIARFNRGLDQLKKDGTYAKIAQKWGFYEGESPSK